MPPEESQQVSQSYLLWMYQALGPLYGILLPLIGLLLFLGACLVVALSRRPGVIAAYLPFFLLPIGIGLLGTVQGMLSSYSVIAQAQTTSRPSEMAEGISLSLFSTLVGLAVTFPGFLVTAIGLFVRSIYARTDEK